MEQTYSHEFFCNTTKDFFFFFSLQEVFIATTLSLLLQSILVKQTIFHMVFISSSLSSCLSSLEPEF